MGRLPLTKDSVFGDLTSTGKIEKRIQGTGKRHRNYYEFNCSNCESRIFFRRDQAKKLGHCGCKTQRYIDLTDQRFGRWLAIRHKAGTNAGGSKWWCRCECGTEKWVDTGSLTSSATRSCGCLSREISAVTILKIPRNHKARLTHGHSYSDTYRTWSCMKQRCKTHKKYVSDGISVCDRWLNSFENFLEDMGERPFKKAQLDRIDNFKGYSPDNCRWATPKENSNNKKRHQLGTQKSVNTRSTCNRLRLQGKRNNVILRR